jgi:hypothetical protein
MQDRDVDAQSALPSNGEHERGRGRALVGLRGAADWVGLWLVGPLGLAGCGGGSDPGVQVATDTDGVITTGADGGEPGADETGTEAPYYCIYNTDNAGLAGVKHQCNLEYDLNVTFTVSLADGSTFEVPLSVIGVPTANDESTYEHPYVMACCTDIRDAPGWPFADTCNTYQHEACMSDFIQHVCNAPANWLAASADGFFGDGKAAIEAAAQWLNAHKQECYEHFWTGPDALHNAMLCAPEFDGFFDHTPWEPSETFQYVLPLTNLVVAEVSNIVVAPRSSFGQNVPLEPPMPAEACSHPSGNDGEVPPLSSLVPAGESFAPAEPASIEVDGPELAGSLVHGTGDVGTASVLQWTLIHAEAREIDRWTMTEAAATSVGTASVRASVDHFKLALTRPVTAKALSGRWHIEADAAHFTLSATIDGQGYNVQATNATSIEMRSVSGGTGACPTASNTCVASGPFTIGYDDQAGQSWKLRIPTITWQP